MRPRTFIIHYLGSGTASGSLQPDIFRKQRTFCWVRLLLRETRSHSNLAGKSVWLGIDTMLGFFSFWITAKFTPNPKGGWRLYRSVLFWVLVEDFWHRLEKKGFHACCFCLHFVCLLPGLLPLNRSVETNLIMLRSVLLNGSRTVNCRRLCSTAIGTSGVRFERMVGKSRWSGSQSRGSVWKFRIRLH